MTNDHVDDLIDLYALGALEPDQHAAVEQHLAQCAACSAEFARSAQVVDLLAWTPPQHDPPAGSYQRLIERINSKEAPQRRPVAAPAAGWGARVRGWLFGSAGLRPALAMALLLLAIGMGGWNLILRSRLGDSEAQVAALRQAVESGQSLATLLGAPGTEVVPLADQDPAGHSGRTQLVVNRQHGAAYLAADGLAPLPAGQDYQLWFITDGGPVSAGVFKVDEQGRAAFMLAGAPLPADAHAAGITVEPAGGSAQPSQPPFLMGSF
ncbi:MAG TPA: anti-sigma factor [Herpetosiphonaceae bacterium]